MRSFGTRLAVGEPAGLPGLWRYTYEMQSVWRNNLWMRQGRQVQLRERLRLREEASGGQVDGRSGSPLSRASRRLPEAVRALSLYALCRKRVAVLAPVPRRVMSRHEGPCRLAGHVRWIACIIATFGPGVIQRGVTSALRPLRRGLLAVTVLSLVFALCPCVVCAGMAADDCCASEGPSIGGMCCANDSGSRTVVPSAAVFAFASGLASGHPMAIDAAMLMPVLSHALPTRPIVARAVLRI